MWRAIKDYFIRRKHSSRLRDELYEALKSFHEAAAAKEDWKSRHKMLELRVSRLRAQIKIMELEEQG